jgi:5-methylcytosine-specific restriction endonuclease McrA
VIPKKMGGEHTWTNVVTACIVCNHHKGSRTPDQASMKLLAKPMLPPASAVYYFQTQIANNQDWEQYIRGW